MKDNVTDLNEYRERRLDDFFDDCLEVEREISVSVVASILQYVHRCAEMYQVSDALIHEAVIQAVMGAAADHIRADQEAGAFSDLLNYANEISGELLDDLSVKAGRDTDERQEWRSLMFAHRWRDEKAD